MQTKKTAKSQTDMFHWDFVAGCATGALMVVIVWTLVWMLVPEDAVFLLPAVVCPITLVGGRGLYARFVRPWLQDGTGCQVPTGGEVNKSKSNGEQKMVRRILCTLRLHRWQRWKELDLGTTPKAFGLRVMQERYCEWCNYRQVESI